jgi:hypothetical protein
VRFAPEGLYVAAARIARDAYARIGAQRPLAGGEGQ